MSLLFDVLKKQETESAIPESELPDENDLADFEANPPPEETDSLTGDSVALELDEAVADATGIQRLGMEDTVVRPAEKSLELAPDHATATEAPDSAADFGTKPGQPAAARGRIDTAGDRPDTADAVARNRAAASVWRRRPHVEWALSILFILAVLFVGAAFFIEPAADDTQQAFAASDDARDRITASEPAVPEYQPGNDPARELNRPAVIDTLTDNERQSTSRPPARRAVSSRDEPLRDEPSTDSGAGQKISPAAKNSITQVPNEDPVYARLSLAYAAYQLGDDSSALAHYRSAAELDPNNRDALLGLAAIAQRGGRLTEARNYFQRLLDLNPKDSVAVSAMMALPDDRNATNDESWLKTMLREEPDAAHLHFGLGLRYIAQERWPDAQNAFFEAVRYAPGNADYNFNLAVTLDRLGQTRSAANYYRRAVEFADGAHSFDVSAAKTRLNAISPKSDG